MKEKELEDELEKNLDKIESGLSLIERQKKVDTGVIDLFCRDKKGNYVIVELKKKPDAKVITQLAKYNMALLKSGISKKRLRTILVSLELPKSVRATCEFFNFEIKNLYEGYQIKNSPKKKIGIPNEEELMAFIKRRDLVNFSTIANFYKLNNATVSDMVNLLVYKELVTVKKLGSNKIIRMK
tara:strand:+ start:437 stop:985 length:549 start_codon:yes stop_codon:yes gene_type:complete